MILVNRIYTVLSVILIILVTVFYLVYMSKYENKEYLVYIQSNSSYPLKSTQGFESINFYDITKSSYTSSYGKVYLKAYQSYSNTGRFILIFSSPPSQINFIVENDKNLQVGKSTITSLPTAYYPVYIDFDTSKDTEWLELKYTTSSSTSVLYKLSIEFF